MSCDAARRRGWPAAMLIAALGCAAADAEPAKPPTPRRSFDFVPPRPGEMLPNPKSGVGPPPTLAQFRPVSAMSPAAATPLAPGTGAQTTPAAAPTPPLAAIAPAQARLGEAVARFGIDAVLQRGPDARPGGPALDGAMLQALRGSLAKLPPDLMVEPDRSGPPATVSGPVSGEGGP